MTKLIPFKGYFEQNVTKRTSNDATSVLWNRLFYDEKTIDTKLAILKLFPFFNIVEKEILSFNPNDAFNITPNTLNKEDYDSPIRFSIKSEIVEILQIDNNKITFSNNLKEVYTVKMTNSFVLKRL